MKNKRQGIISIIIAVGFFSVKAYYMGLILSVIGLMLIYKWKTNPLRQLEELIDKDAQKYHAEIPISYPLKMDLIRFYSKYSRLSLLYPTLKSTYSDIVDSMWKNLALAKDKTSWKKIIEFTDKNWPEPIDLQNFVKSK